ncbi:hypothetical protein [Niveibacterium sp.]|uniref:hypothetical protein n=1 Tax=Niveibacterium sp. TaxID=2017444 RepID=UPI0035AF95F6
MRFRVALIVSVLAHLVIAFEIGGGVQPLHVQRRANSLAVNLLRLTPVADQREKSAKSVLPLAAVNYPTARQRQYQTGTVTAEAQTFGIVDASSPIASQVSAPEALRVYEILPEQFEVPLLLDPAVAWHYSTDLDVRPYAQSDLVLSGPSTEFSADVAVFVDVNGNVLRVQIAQDLAVEQAEALQRALGAVKFDPGRLRDEPVASIVFLHFDVPSR